jgi:pyrroline-5-carboxylate reductase
MDKMSLGIIGYGRMGSSLIRGALNSKLISARETRVCDADATRLQMARDDGLTIVDGFEGLASSDTILLAVKPKDAPAVLDGLKVVVTPGKTLIISIAAGLRLAAIESRLGEGSRIVRLMPNLAASVNEAATAFIPNRWALATDIAFVEALLNGIGLSFRLEDESTIDIVTGLSGSGPAYFFLLMKAMEKTGKKFGLPDELIRSLIAQTCRGAGTLALETDLSFDQLITAVASPGGTTEEALKVMESKGLSAIVIDAVSAAIEKSIRMSRS